MKTVHFLPQNSKRTQLFYHDICLKQAYEKNACLIAMYLPTTVKSETSMIIFFIY